jgi:S1-C subfamily serine protease
VFGRLKINSKNLEFKNCHDVDHLARWLGFENYSQFSTLYYPINKIPTFYINFTIPKKNSELRQIFSPKKPLKLIQKKIAEGLEGIYSPKKSVHGFIKGRSIVSNATPHVDKQFVLNIDLKNFFTTIHFGRVKYVLQSPPFKFPSEVATVLAHICCLNNNLPQGAPTSPIISNIICYKLDKELQSLAQKFRCTYTRYADDITFSFTQKRSKLPKSLVTLTRDSIVKLGGELKSTIEDNGFIINYEKLRISSPNMRQDVTGITVNKKPNVQRKFIRALGSRLYSWDKFGLEKASHHFYLMYYDKVLTPYKKEKIDKNKSYWFKKFIRGQLAYIKTVRGENDHIYRKYAYKYSTLIGKPKKSLLTSSTENIKDSIFIINNDIDVAQGSAFLIEKIGLITNQHVVSSINEKNVNKLEVFRDMEAQKYRAVKFKKSCYYRDLAIFRPSKEFNGIKRLPIGDDKYLKEGEKVTVLGYPSYNLGDSAYINTGKIVQKKKLHGQEVWMLDIPIIHGNSGGPVVNENNQVIGIASNGSESNDFSTAFHGFIPISTLIKYDLEK